MACGVTATSSSLRVAYWLWGRSRSGACPHSKSDQRLNRAKRENLRCTSDPPRREARAATVACMVAPVARPSTTRIMVRPCISGVAPLIHGESGLHSSLEQQTYHIAQMYTSNPSVSQIESLWHVLLSL